MTPYEEFNKIYEEEIKTRYQQADLILKTKIDEVENGIKEKTKELALEYFNEYKASKTVIKDNYLNLLSKTFSSTYLLTLIILKHKYYGRKRKNS